MKKISTLCFCMLLCSISVQSQTPEINGIPIIKINTRNNEEVLNKDTWVNIQSFVLIDPDDSENNITRVDLPQDDRIRGRGNTTWSYPKKPYRLRFRENVSIFGLPAAENWVLLAEYQDPTFLLNATTFYLGRNVFELPFTCSYQQVHLYFNERYEGIYGFTEHRQADPLGVGAPGRPKIDAENGWFVELDSYWDESPKFKTTNYDLPIMIKSPEAENDAENDDNPFYDFVKNDWNELCNLMAAPSFPENGYRDLIDMNTFVDFLMINEIVKNKELGWPKSTFAYKNTEGKICMGPLWDFDWAFGYTGEGHNYFTNPTIWSGKHPFFHRFFEDPVFVAMYKERWQEKYPEIANVSNYINEMGTKLETSVNADTERWKIDNGYLSDYPENYLDEITRMKTWWNNRVAWLNSAIPDITVNIADVSTKKTLNVYVNNGQLYAVGLTEGKECSIYNMMGAIVWHNVISDSEITVNLPTKGIYILLHENNAVKFIYY